MRLGIDEYKRQIKELERQNAAEHRKKYIAKFINTESVDYKNHILNLKQYSDGLCYEGYLWDFLYDFSKIYFDDLQKYRSAIKKINVFWDIHSSEKILINDYWKFNKDSVIELDFNLLLDNLGYLPEDIYISNENIEWSLILTHEYENNKRICISVGDIPVIATKEST
jgi:hypothetical protein